MLNNSYGRRRFLQTGALFTAGFLGTSLVHPRRTIAKDDESVEALVIGTGYGGAVAALRLGQAGINTVVLERGRRWPITPAQNTFATYRKPDGRAAWLSSKTLFGQSVDVYTGVLETKVEDGITVLAGAGCGGGSLVNNAGMVVPRNREVFYQVYPKSLRYEELVTTYFDRVRSILQPTPIPPDVLATNYYDSTRLFREHATKAGFSNYLLDLAVDWNIVREEIAGTKVASTIIGEVWYGCNSGAKKSLDGNYLFQAEKTGFVEILPLHIATEITELPENRYRVSYNRLNESGEVLESKSITCRYLFLAAGSLGTSKLLFKAKAKGTLRRLNDYVGKEWGTNGDTNGTRSNLLPAVTGKGGFAGAILEYFDNPNGPIIMMDYPNWNGGPGTQLCLGMGTPKPKGTFTYNAATDSVTLHWPSYPQENRDFVLATELTYKTLDEKNATSIGAPKTDILYQNVAHPLGGVVMGKACDLYGRVFGYKGLYVIDGALIPGTAACANPALTIAGLAERSIEKILSEDITHGHHSREESYYSY